MNLNANDIVSGAEQLLSNLQDGVSISDITSIVQLPELDQFSQLASSLLPQNLVQIDENGSFKLLDPLSLQQAVKSGVDSVKGLIEEEIKGVIDEVTSTFGQASEIVDSVTNTLQSLGEGNIEESLGFFDEALGSVSGLLGFSADTSTLTQYSKTVSDVANSIKNFSPKQIRDLADPDIRNNVISSTLETATTLLESDVIQTASQYVQLPVSVGAVTSLFTTANSLLGKVSNENGSYSVDVNISTYYGKGPGADLEAYDKKSSTGKQLISGKSCQVDGVKIPYGSKVEVPGLGTFEAVDRIKTGGGDLKLYYDTLNEALKADLKISGITVVKVTPPGGTTFNKQSLVSNRGDSAKLM